MKCEKLLTELIELENSNPVLLWLSVRGTNYQLSDIAILKKSTPLTKKSVRGGVYISDKFVYQIKATIFDSRLANSLSDLMLGPNFEFEDLEISVDNSIENWRSMYMVVNLVNSVQKQSKTELTMNIIKIRQK